MSIKNECAFCKKEYESERVSSRYCSDTCRVKYNNIMSQAYGHLDAILINLKKIEGRAKEFPEFIIEFDEILQLVKNKAFAVQLDVIDPHRLIEAQNRRILDDTGGTGLWHCEKCGKIVSSEKEPVKECKCEHPDWHLQKNLI